MDIMRWWYQTAGSIGSICYDVIIVVRAAFSFIVLRVALPVLVCSDTVPSTERAADEDAGAYDSGDGVDASTNDDSDGAPAYDFGLLEGVERSALQIGPT